MYKNEFFLTVYKNEFFLTVYKNEFFLTMLVKFNIVINQAVF
jgi:hypothetical protein